MSMVTGRKLKRYHDGIKSLFADKNKYGDSTVNVGRRPGTEVGVNSFVFASCDEEDEYSAASGYRSVVLGGYDNTASGHDSAVLGGYTNTASDFNSAVLGGYENTASGQNSVILGGDSNRASGYGSAVLCGNNNTSAGSYSAVMGGVGNSADNYGSFVCGKYNSPMHTGGDEFAQAGDAFVIGNGTGHYGRSNAMRVSYTGFIYGTKSFNSSGADYAEYIKEWADGNPDYEDRVGYFVTLKNGMLYKANEGDYIAGITSGNPSVVGNADEDYYWKYARDAFNRIVMEDVPEIIMKTEKKLITQFSPLLDEKGNQIQDGNGNPLFAETPLLDGNGNEQYEDVPMLDEAHKPIMIETGNIIPNARMRLADDYAPSLQEGYIERKDRKEWDYVGMVGVIPVRDDGTCLPDRFCKCGQDGIATLAAERGFDTFYVIERISENVVSVELR